MEFFNYPRLLGASVIAILSASPSIGWGADASTAAGAITSAGDAIKVGDHITVLSDAPIFYQLNAANTKSWYCAPGNSRFTVNAIDANKTATEVSAAPAAPIAPAAVPAAAPVAAAPAVVGAKVTTAGGKSTTVVQGVATVTQSTDSILYVNFPGTPADDDVLARYFSPVNWYRHLSPDIKNNGKCQSSNNPDGYKDLVAGAYEVSATDLQKYGLQRRGFTWGGLVVPYKFEFHDRTFQAVPSVVGYVGYEGWWSGVSLANIVALGGGAVASSSATAATAQSINTGASSSSTSSSSKTTYTAAIGEIATFGGSYKIGVLVGWDWQGTGSGFRYEGKPWIAISAGF